MLSNAYFLAKFRFDTAENEPAKNLQNFRKMHFREMHFSKMLSDFLSAQRPRSRGADMYPGSAMVCVSTHCAAGLGAYRKAGRIETHCENSANTTDGDNNSPESSDIVMVGNLLTPR